MIHSIKKENVPECVLVIRNSFITVANEYGFTEKNAPCFTAFATTNERLKLQLDEGRKMFAYFDEKNKIVGYYALHLLEDGECELNNLCVLPEYRHRQIGRYLFYHSLTEAAKADCKTIKIGFVEENKKLRSWYEKLGAKHISAVKYDIFPFTCGYMEKSVYLQELTLDLHDYIVGGTIFKRKAVRGIIKRNNRYLVIHGKYGDYKFPGGGMNSGENILETLYREVLEETGFTVIPESVKDCILVHEKRKGYPEDLMEMDSWYWFCDVNEIPGEQNLDCYEKEYDYQVDWMTLEDLILKNESVTDYENIPWVVRETMVMRRLMSEVE